MDRLGTDDDFEAEVRLRCKTWPSSQFSDYFGEPQSHFVCANSIVASGSNHDASPDCSNDGERISPSGERSMSSSNAFYEPTQFPFVNAQGSSSSQLPSVQLEHRFLVPSTSEDNLTAAKAKKRRPRRKPDDAVSQKKPNPWGEESYSDLIARALNGASEKRMKLNDIYQWFTANVSYFRDRSNSEDAAGWKNSIRHNLSLHSRFMRIQNEGAGKSSWWVINPDAKPGRNPRRQRAATMESSTKAALEKKRRGARKKVLEMRAAGSLQNATGSLVSSQASVANRDLFGDNDDSLNNFEPIFRQRTQSNLSVPPRISPTEQHYDDFDFPPFVEASAMPGDILNRTSEMTLTQENGSSAYQRTMGNPLLSGANDTSSSSSQQTLLQHVKPDPITNGIKTDLDGVQPPPSYHVLNNARGVSHSQNPLLNASLVHRAPPPGVGSYNGIYGAANHGLQWLPHGIRPQISCAQQTMGQAGLPMDLENLTLPEQPFMDDMESVIRQELSQSTTNQLSFD